MSVSTYSQNLVKVVLDASEANSWKRAVLEWEIADCEKDDCLETSCICGKENLRYLFTIRNDSNDNELFPIGSSCIKKFERADMKEAAALSEQLFRLLHAIEGGKFISLSSEFFSRKLLAHLHELDVFQATEFNNYQPVQDYEFLLKMFNKRNKDSITAAQNKKLKQLLFA
ncbi:MAG: hypothetical protein FWC86_04525 [Coriobacteriia bacterium]|nr:hypothetical protein [Coriobacteriia bacterium]